MKTKVINVAKDFSEFPLLRLCSLSENSGEEFYHKLLNKSFVKAYENGEKLIVNLDGTDGYASSFLDEAFGNLVYDFTLEVIKKNVEIISFQVPHWIKMIEQETYSQWEIRRKKNEHPIVTKEHPAWYRLIDNDLKLNVWEHPVAFA